MDADEIKKVRKSLSESTGKSEEEISRMMTNVGLDVMDMTEETDKIVNKMADLFTKKISEAMDKEETDMAIKTYTIFGITLIGHILTKFPSPLRKTIIDEALDASFALEKLMDERRDS